MGSFFWISVMLCVITQVSICYAPIPPARDVQPLYHPTALNTTWTGEAFPCGKYSAAITKVTKVKDGVTIKIESRSKDKLHRSDEIKITETGIYWVERGGMQFTPPLCVLKLPVKHGEIWEQDTVFCGTNVHVIHTTLPLEQVKLLFGTVGAIPVKQELVFGKSTDPKPVIYWYAPNLGCIKAATDDWVHDIMTTFQPGGR